MTQAAKFKLCPACGRQNRPGLLECAQCEADLTAVKITDPTIAQAAPPVEAAPLQGPQPGELCRLCECGAPNPPQLRKCAVCGEDISDIAPGPYDAAPAEPVFYLTDEAGLCFNITEAEYVLGRAAALSEYLADKYFVSRRHAKLNLCNNVLFIENLSATNPTFVNNEQLLDGQPHTLKDGDEICLGGCRLKGKIPAQAACFKLKVQT